MGAYSPAPIVTPALHARIMREVIEPTLRGLRADGNPYLGISLRRFDDRRRRHAQCARIQLPFRRSRDPADSDAAAERSRRPVRGGARRHAAIGSKPAGIRARRSASSWRPAATPTPTAKAIRSAASMPPRDCPEKYFTPALAPRARKSSPPAAACCARSAWAIPSPPRKRQAYELVHAIHWNLVQYRRDIGYRAIARASNDSLDRSVSQAPTPRDRGRLAQAALAARGGARRAPSSRFSARCSIGRTPPAAGCASREPAQPAALMPARRAQTARFLRTWCGWKSSKSRKSRCAVRRRWRRPRAPHDTARDRARCAR